ncbi:MAG: hypothetical protein L6R42_007377, partial [Xanthoria sp. 1 TBL-2021]
MVYRRLNGRATVEPVRVNSSDTGQQLFEIIKGKQHELAKLESRMWFFNLLWTRLDVGIAEIRWTSTNRNKTEVDGARVDLKSFEQHNLFSEAIRHPALLANEPDFLTEYGSLALGKPDGIYGFVGQQVLVVYPAADKEKIAWLLL